MNRKSNTFIDYRTGYIAIVPVLVEHVLSGLLSGICHGTTFHMSHTGSTKINKLNISYW